MGLQKKKNAYLEHLRRLLCVSGVGLSFVPFPSSESKEKELVCARLGVDAQPPRGRGGGTPTQPLAAAEVGVPETLLLWVMMIFITDGNHSLIAASSPASSSCAAAEAGCRHSAVSSPSCSTFPVSVKNVGGLEDGGGTELASEAAVVEMLRASGRLLAARPGQPAPSSGVPRLLETEQGSPAQKEARPAGTRPAPTASIRSPDTGSPGTILVALARLPLAPSTVFLTFLTL